MPGDHSREFFDDDDDFVHVPVRDAPDPPHADPRQQAIFNPGFQDRYAQAQQQADTRWKAGERKRKFVEFMRDYGGWILFGVLMVAWLVTAAIIFKPQHALSRVILIIVAVPAVFVWRILFRMFMRRKE